MFGFNFLQRFWLGDISERINDHKTKAKLATSDECIRNTNMGEICVIGDESVGKDTTLERLLELRIFDRGEGLVTRFAIRIKLIFSPIDKTPKMRFAMPGKAIVETIVEKEIHDAVKANNDEIEASGVGISDIEALLEIYSNKTVNIDLVNLPGLISHAKDREPEDLPKTVKTMVSKYISKPNSVVLSIVDGKANERNSPAAALLKEIKPKTVIKIFTKVDCLVDVRQPDGPLASFVKMFNSEEKNVVALSNYAPKPTSTFEEIRQEEINLFKNNLDWKLFQYRVGIDALLKSVNRIAESASRGEWATKQKAIEEKNLIQNQDELKSQGPELPIGNIISTVVTGLVGNDVSFEALITQAWTKSSYLLPDVNIWTAEANIDITLFLRHFEAAVVEKTKNIFATHESKLHRYKVFEVAFYNIFSEKLKERTPYFLKRWELLANKIQIDHDTLSTYSPAEYLRAAKCCLIQNVLMCLQDSPNGPVAPTLAVQLSLLMRGLPAEEHPEAIAIRNAYNLKIKTIKEILELLPSSNTN